jgi:hypothetical protein
MNGKKSKELRKEFFKNYNEEKGNSEWRHLYREAKKKYKYNRRGY